ncbi:MAG: peptidyl-prolyl cis-trans isomerase [Helicobacteraceae bacterium]|nr:peptidyl-prolyl cis-trans isomerase [Helicobacteraceae bacterium]
MMKLFLPLLLVGSLYAQITNGVAIIVKGEAITLYEIQKEMELAKIDAKRASDALIRKKLEEQETQERKISVTSEEVYDDIKKTAAANNMSVSQFYDAVRESNGLSSTELKEKIKEKLLSQKLYASIAYSAVSEPSEGEIKEYYALHKEEFSHPNTFEVTIYSAGDGSRLQEKIDNPMFYAPDVHTEKQTLPYNRISPELASLLESTKVDSFTPVVPDGKGGFFSFYIHSVEAAQEGDIQGARDEIINAIMAEKREQVLGDYFARLRHNADIKIVRMPE